MPHLQEVTIAPQAIERFRPLPSDAEMRAMVLERPGKPLQLTDLPGEGQVLLEVHACGRCRTDLHLIDGELPDPKLPVIPATRSSGRW